MRPFILAILFTISIVAASNAPGILAIAILQSRWYNKELCIRGNQLAVCQSGSQFKSVGDGSIEVVPGHKFLNVNSNGMVVVGDDKQCGFSWVRMFAYTGNPKFWLCNDMTVSHEKTTECGRVASLYYVPLETTV